MDKTRFELGLAQRKSTLGADYVPQGLECFRVARKVLTERNMI